MINPYSITTTSKGIRKTSDQKLVSAYRQLFREVTTYRFLNNGAEPYYPKRVLDRVKAEIDRRNIIIHHPENTDE